jgi:hypothetical protein
METLADLQDQAEQAVRDAVSDARADMWNSSAYERQVREIVAEAAAINREQLVNVLAEVSTDDNDLSFEEIAERIAARLEETR